MFMFEMRGQAVTMDLNRCLELLEIVRVDTPEPLVGTLSDVFLVEPKHALPARGEVHLVGRQVPVPESVVRTADGQGVPLFALAERQLRTPSRQLHVNPRKRHREVDGFRDVVVRARYSRPRQSDRCPSTPSP